MYDQVSNDPLGDTFALYPMQSVCLPPDGTGGVFFENCFLKDCHIGLKTSNSSTTDFIVQTKVNQSVIEWFFEFVLNFSQVWTLAQDLKINDSPVGRGQDVLSKWISVNVTGASLRFKLYGKVECPSVTVIIESSMFKYSFKYNHYAIKLAFFD